MRFSESIKKFIERSDLDGANGTVKAYEYDLKQFCIYVHNLPITEVKEEHVVGYMRLLTELKYQNNTLIPKRQALVNFFKYWQKKGYFVLDHDLIPKVKREFKMPDVATEEDYRKVLAAIPKNTNDAVHIRNRAILSLLEATGCRNGELCSINIDEPDLQNRKVLIKTEKNKGSKPFREVFWVGNDEAQEALLAWIKKRSEMQKVIVFRDPDALFVGVRGWQTGKRLTNSAICIALRKISRRAGLSYNFHPHMLRHKYGHDLNNSGANGFVISDLMGHSKVDSTRIYTVMNDQEAREAYIKYKMNNSTQQPILLGEERLRLKRTTRSLYKQGLSLRDVAKNVGKSHVWVAQVIKEKSL